MSFIGELKLNGDAQLADRDARLAVELHWRAEAQQLKLNGDAQLADRDAQLAVELHQRAEA